MCAGSVDGTIYIASPAGFFTGICPNGIGRFVATFPGTQSTAAIVPDPNFFQPTPITIIGGVGGQVRAYNVRGRQYWSFFASATVVAATVVDQSTEIFYVADTAGRVFAANLINGQADPSFSFATEPVDTGVQPPPRPGITASPALGNDSASVPKLYVADQGLSPDRGGTLYALDRATGEVCWTFEADGPISSSPAVATGGPTDVIVFAADVLAVVDPAAGPVAVGGRVYALPDAECNGQRRTRGDALWIFDPASIDPPGHSYSFGAASPALGADGTVYIGRTGNRRGDASECPGGSPCVINDGGAVYAIAPAPPG
jgi:outer membrane protein assembly factor BamB